MPRPPRRSTNADWNALSNETYGRTQRRRAGRAATARQTVSAVMEPFLNVSPSAKKRQLKEIFSFYMMIPTNGQYLKYVDFGNNLDDYNDILRVWNYYSGSNQERLRLRLTDAGMLDTPVYDQLVDLMLQTQGDPDNLRGYMSYNPRHQQLNSIMRPDTGRSFSGFS
jgi:hypothetical protein